MQHTPLPSEEKNLEKKLTVVGKDRRGRANSPKDELPQSIRDDTRNPRILDLGDRMKDTAIRSTEHAAEIEIIQRTIA